MNSSWELSAKPGAEHGQEFVEFDALDALLHLGKQLISPVLFASRCKKEV